MKEACRDCRFFEAAHGECRHMSPTFVVARGVRAWPPVGPEDWCGRFEAPRVPAASGATPAGELSRWRSDRAVAETLARRKGEWGVK